MSISESIEVSDVSASLAALDTEMGKGGDPWDLHLSLFPSVQKVLNPPFINPHLPKMYAICREFRPKVEKRDLVSLVRLEITEYARRPKLQDLPKKPAAGEVIFEDIEDSLAGGDPGETARLMASFWKDEGPAEFSRRILLLGSGYLEKSLGHSISCTAFILLEAMERKDQDPWPVLVLLADYFHKGKFHETPAMRREPVPEEEMHAHLLRAASGRGIIDLHDTITIYAIDRVRHLFDQGEQSHLVRSWIDFLADKEFEKVVAEPVVPGRALTYEHFYAAFSLRQPRDVLSAACGILDSVEGLPLLANYLIRGVCDLYQGNYNPHHLTGLGSLLWVLERYPENRQLLVNALYQYLDYFFAELGKAQ